VSGIVRNAARKDTVLIIAQVLAPGTIKDKIRNLAEEGLSSNEVADRLGLSLSVVNKYW
jgi:predicted transcriptional regulator